MKNKLLVALLAITTAVCCVFGFTACGNTESEEENGSTEPEKIAGSEGLEYTLSDDGTHYIASGIGTCTQTQIEIASWYNNHWVTEIKDKAFYGCSSLENITIPSSVTLIGGGAFYGCSSLENITIPSSVTLIGDGAFEDCSSLESITIPNSVKSIGWYAFKNTAYYKDENNWEGGVLYIGKHLIKAKYTISNDNIIKQGTITIADFAFEDCSNLTSIAVPNSVTTIGNGAFRNCSGLESIIVLAGNTKYHSAGNCIIETASKTLIAGCKNSVIPSDGSVTSIGNQAFLECSSLTSISIPDDVTEIGIDAFYDCSSLTSITFNGTKTQWNAIEKNSYWNYGTGSYTIHCTDGDIAKGDS